MTVVFHVSQPSFRSEFQSTLWWYWSSPGIFAPQWTTCRALQAHGLLLSKCARLTICEWRCIRWKRGEPFARSLTFCRWFPGSRDSQRCLDVSPQVWPSLWRVPFGSTQLTCSSHSGRNSRPLSSSRHSKFRLSLSSRTFRSSGRS